MLLCEEARPETRSAQKTTTITVRCPQSNCPLPSSRSSHRMLNFAVILITPSSKQSPWHVIKTYGLISMSAATSSTLALGRRSRSGRALLNKQNASKVAAGWSTGCANRTLMNAAFPAAWMAARLWRNWLLRGISLQ